jgi:formyl-CoA transferase
MGKALEGVRVLDMTHVQSGPSCTQILGWLGADVVKVEALGGDITRKQLRDLPDVDSLYFTMLNCNKRSITLNMKAMGGSMSTTGFEDGPPLATGTQIGDSGTGMHAVAGILAALYQREHTGRGQRVSVAMQHAVLNLCRVKLRDQQRLAHGPLAEYPNEDFDDAVPRSGNASGGGQPGWAVRCSPGGPNDYIYVIVQPVGWEPIAKLIGRPELATDPEWSTPEARLNKLDKMFQLIEEWTITQNKYQVLAKLNQYNVPCGPILSTKELIEDESLADNEMVVRVEHPERGEFTTVGCPIKLSDSPVEILRSPLLGEHNEDIYSNELGLKAAQLAELKSNGVI